MSGLLYFWTWFWSFSCVVDLGWSDDTEVNSYLCRYYHLHWFTIKGTNWPFFVFLEIFGISVLKYSCTILKNFEGFQLTLSISILFHEVTEKLVVKMGLMEKLSAILSQQLTPLFLKVDFFINNLCSRFCATR